MRRGGEVLTPREEYTPKHPFCLDPNGFPQSTKRAICQLEMEIGR